MAALESGIPVSVQSRMIHQPLPELLLERVDLCTVPAYRVQSTEISRSQLHQVVENVKTLDIRRIDLTFKQLTSQAAHPLGELIENTQLERLLLGRNFLGNTGTKILASALATGKSSLLTLDLRLNEITDSGLIAIAQSLVSCGLKRLVLDNNKFSFESVKALVECLRHSEVQYLSLRACGLDESSITALEMLFQSSNMAVLDLRDNQSLWDEDATITFDNPLVGSKGRLCLRQPLSPHSNKRQRLTEEG